MWFCRYCIFSLPRWKVSEKTNHLVLEDCWTQVIGMPWDRIFFWLRLNFVSLMRMTLCSFCFFVCFRIHCFSCLSFKLDIADIFFQHLSFSSSPWFFSYYFFNWLFHWIQLQSLPTAHFLPKSNCFHVLSEKFFKNFGLEILFMI